MPHPTRSPSAKSSQHGSHAADSHDARPLTVLQCGCAMPDASSAERKAVAVDPEAKARNVKRLRRIEGQVRGLQKMVEEERYCAEVLTQVSSVHEALRGVGRAMLHNHLRHCATEAIGSGDRDRAEAMYDELMDLIYRSVR
jgi:DNA-binding FrmR family transcriptional regulator